MPDLTPGFPRNNVCFFVNANWRRQASLVPRPSSRAVDPLPEKVKREEGLVKLYHATDVTGRKEVERT